MSQKLSVDQINLLQPIRLSVPAEFKYLNIVGACVTGLLEREVNLPEQKTLISQVELALHETCTNIIEHAYAGMRGRINLEFSIANQPRSLVIDLFDKGRTFSITDIEKPNLSLAHTSGYGLFLIHELLDEVLYEPEYSNNHWRLVKYL